MSGAEAGGVGQRAGLLDRAQEGGDATVVAAQLEDLLDHGAVLAGELAGVLVVGVAVVDLLDLDVQGAVVVHVVAAPAMPRCRPTTVATGTPRRETAVLDHLGDDADAAELAVTAGDEEDALVLADVDRQGRGDGREDDRVVESDTS